MEKKKRREEKKRRREEKRREEKREKDLDNQRRDFSCQKVYNPNPILTTSSLRFESC